MRAYRLTQGGGIEGLTRVDLPEPAPGPGEVAVRVRATSLNYRDLGVARRSAAAVIPLSDGAGEIVAVGEGARLAIGDRVCGCFMPHWRDGDVTPEYQRDALGGTVDGMLAEVIVLPAASVVRIPDYLSFEEAATLPCAAVTAWNALFEATHLKPGQTVLLLGTGGVSIFGLQLGVAAGMRTIVTSSSNEKLAQARALGAHATVNYREQEDWERAVLELTNGRGVDLVLEVGGVGTFAKSNACTRVGGSIVIIGALAPDQGGGLAPLVARNVRATRISVGSRRMFEDMNRALEVGGVRPVIDRVFEFEQALEAYRYLESQAHFGKVVVRV